MMNDTVIEKLVELANKADTILPSYDYRPTRMELAFINGITEIRDELRALVNEYSDEDPWEGEYDGST